MAIENMNKKLHERNFTRYGFDMNVFVSLVAAILVLGFIIFTIALPDTAADFFNNVKNTLNSNFNWLLVFTLNLAIFFVLYLALSKFGRIKLGGPKAETDFSNLAWYSMLFSAGIGIGIFFYGISEPLQHLNIPEQLGSGTTLDAFKVMYLHWGAHAWAIYGLVAIGLGFFAYNKKLPLSLRSLFYPLFKDKIYGLLGDLIDTLAVLSVLFGLATSLGVGAQQINSGLNYVFGVPFNSTIQVILIVIITFFATLSVITGLDKGIKFLSEANMFLSISFLLIVLLVGPTVYILSTYFSGLGLYLKDFFEIGFFTATKTTDIKWQGDWTIFYWAWWISWSPFVGIFIARISKGRTIRELAFGVVVIPSLITFFAMTILGATGIYLNKFNDGVMEAAVKSNVATALFEMIQNLSDSGIFQLLLSILGMISITLFFVTSSDSGSLVVDNLTSGGKLDSPKTQRVFWASMEGLIALSVLLLGGQRALQTLQSAVIITGVPFAILIIIMMYSLYIELQPSYRRHRRHDLKKLKNRLEELE